MISYTNIIYIYICRHICIVKVLGQRSLTMFGGRSLAALFPEGQQLQGAASYEIRWLGNAVLARKDMYIYIVYYENVRTIHG